MQKALDSYLTFENIPIRQTRIFNLKTSEGHYNCWAAAWNADWICGFITKGSSVGVFDAYHFMRFVSQGADTVLKKLGSNIVYLGQGMSLDVRSKLPNYKELTVNNFLVFPLGGYATTTGSKGTGDTIRVSCYMDALTYNPTTGILTNGRGYGRFLQGAADQSTSYCGSARFYYVDAPPLTE